MDLRRSGQEDFLDKPIWEPIKMKHLRQRANKVDVKQKTFHPSRGEDDYLDKPIWEPIKMKDHPILAADINSKSIQNVD